MIYICIPAHNEEQTVGVVLWKIRQVMAEYPRDYQLLVVDDASTDKTPEVLAPYARVLPLTVVRSDSRQGEGGAIEMMLREAVRRSEYPKRDVAITLQADFTQEPDELVGLIKRMEAGADIVVGETRPGPDVSVWVRWARTLSLRVLGRSRVPAGVKDPFTGYRAYRVAVVKGALADRPGRLIHWGGWAGAAELLLATAPHARRIDTVELVERRERLQRASRLRPWRSLLDVWSLAREAKPLQVASPAELDQAMRSVAAVRTSEVNLRSGGRPERPQRPERPRGSTEERRARDPERKPRSEAQHGSRTKRGERPAAGSGGERAQRKPEGSRGGEHGRPPKSEAHRTRRDRSPQVAVEAEAVPVQPVTAENGTAVQPGAPEKARRKRPRRRKRGSSERVQAAADGAAATSPPILEELLPEAGDLAGNDSLPPTVPDGPVQSGEPSDESSDAVAGGEREGRARRRRRGRRGGRRRAAGAAGEVGGEPAGPAEAGGSGLDTAEQLAILELIEGDRGNTA